MEYFHYLVLINQVQKSLFKISVLYSEYSAKYEAWNIRYEMLVKKFSEINPVWQDARDKKNAVRKWLSGTEVVRWLTA